MKIACDIDNVVADFGKTIDKYAKYYNPEFDMRDVKDYDFRGVFPDGVFRKIVQNFQHSGEYRNMSTISGAVEANHRLYEKGHQVYFLTTRNYYPSIWMDTLFWLDKKGFKFEEMFHNLNLGKLPLIQTLGLEVLVDDDPKEIEEVSDKNIPCVIFDQPWNQEVNENLYVKRLSQWEWIVHYLDDLESIKNGKRQA